MLRTLQKKPLHTRIHVAFMASFIMVMIVAAFWVVTLPTKFADIRSVNDQAAAAQEAARNEESAQSNQDTTALLNSLVASTTEVYRDLGSQLQDISGAPQAEAPPAASSETTTVESASSTITIRELN